jgi:hypothetical protein
MRLAAWGLRQLIHSAWVTGTGARQASERLSMQAPLQQSTGGIP